MDKIDRIKAYLATLAGGDGVEGIAPPKDARDPGLEGPDGLRWLDGWGALDKLAEGTDLDPTDLGTLEALIIPAERPAIDVVRGSYTLPEHVGTGRLRFAELDPAEVRARVLPGIAGVGRVEVPSRSDIPYGGTAFHVGPNLLMTNRHVAALFAVGVGRHQVQFRSGAEAACDLLKERARADADVVRVVEVVLIHPFWDMALLRVEGLQDRAPLTLSSRPADDLLPGAVVAVVGYPAFDVRNDRAVQDTVFDKVYGVKRFQPGRLGERRRIRSFRKEVNALTHDASTLGGNSGSAMIDPDTGEVIGLHFAGRYLDANFAVPAGDLALDSLLHEAGVNFAPGANPTDPWADWWRKADPDAPAAKPPATTISVTPKAPAAGARRTRATIDIPITITLNIGADGSVSTGRDGADSEPDEGGIEAPGTKPDPDYSGRAGYDPEFLGVGDRAVKVPWLTSAQYRNTSRLDGVRKNAHVLPYHHFSVVMNKARRMPYVTCVNIDARKYWPIERSQFRDKWALDPRIPAEEQQNNDLYRDKDGVHNPLDRGHLVRRVDPVWGDTWEEAVGAHHDTFHYTNCAPQHKGFNRNYDLWLGLEQYVLRELQTDDLRATVFAGPVFDQDGPDGVYDTPAGESVALPKSFWKVVVALTFTDAGESLNATAYLLSQEEAIEPLVESAFDTTHLHQVTIEHLEEVTGLSFRGLSAFDPLAKATDHEAAATGPRRLESFVDVAV